METRPGPPGQSLWNLMSEHVPPSELSKVRAALGDNLVDLYTDAHSEVEKWHKIRQGMQQQGGRHGNRAGTPLPRLADPPAIKELLRAEIRMLLRSIRERAAASEGRDGEEVLCRYKPETVNYALGDLSNPGDTNTSQYGSRSSSRCSVQSSIEDEIEAVRDKLNVSDLDKVVDHLKSILTEECEVLKSQVKHLQENMKKHKSDCEAGKSEPTLAELKDLRGAIQMDLELYPSSFSSSSSAPSPLPMNNRFGLSSALKSPDKTLQPLTPTPVLRPHPPPLCQTKPSPPAGAPKTSASIRKLSTRSLVRTRDQHGSTASSTEPSKTHAPLALRLDTAGRGNTHLTTSLPGYSPEGEGDQKNSRTQTGSPILQAHLSNPCKTIGPSTDRVLSPQAETKSRLVCRSKSASVISSPILAFSSHCDAGGNNGGVRTESSVTTTGRPKAQNEPQRSSGSSLVTVHVHNETWNSASGSFYSGVIEKRSFVSNTGGSLARNGNVKIDTGMNRNKNSRPEKDAGQQKSPRGKRLTDHLSHQRQAASSLPAFTQILDTSSFPTKDHLEALQVIQ